MAGNPRTAPLLAARRSLLGRAVLACAASLAPCRFALAGHAVRPWPQDRPAPALDLVDLAGQRWHLEAYAGQVVVLNFWATWCEPCRIEMPSLAAMAGERRGQGVAVAAVNYLESAEAIGRYLERAPFAATILRDSDGDAAAAWTPRVFPSTVLIARSGKPVHTVVGELDWQGAEARALLDPLVAAPRGR